MKNRNSGSWISNVIALVSLVVAIAALICSHKTSVEANEISNKQVVQDKELIYLSDQLSKEKDEYDHLKEVVYELYGSIIKVEISEPSNYTDSEYRKELILADTYQEDLNLFYSTASEFVVLAKTNSLILLDKFEYCAEELDTYCALLKSSYQMLQISVELNGKKSKKNNQYLDNYDSVLTTTKEYVAGLKEIIEVYYRELNAMITTEAGNS